MLEGRPVVIKRNVDAATAERYIQRLQAIGVEARSEAQTLDVDTEALESAPIVARPDACTRSAQSASSMNEEQQCKAMAEQAWRQFLTFAAQGSLEMGTVCANVA